MCEETNDKLIKLISEINEENILVKYDLEKGKYKIDEKIEEAIKNKVRYEQDKIRNIYESYADWNYKNDKEVLAIEYYYKSGNLQRIFEIIEKTDFVYNEELNSDLLKRIIYAAGDDFKLKFPIGYLKLIYINMDKFEFNKCNKILNDLEIIYKENNRAEDKEKILSEIYLLKSILDFSNNNLRKTNIKKIIAYENKSEVLNLKRGFLYGKNNILYFIHDKSGELYNNIKEYMAQLDILNNIASECEYGVEHLVMAEYYTEVGAFVEAENYAYKSLYKSKMKNSKSIILLSYFVLMKIYAYSKNDEKLDATLKLLETENWIKGIYFEQYEDIIFYINQIRSDKKNVLEIIEKDKVKLDWTNCLSMCRYFINRNEFLKLEVYIEHMESEYVKNNTIFGLIYVNIFRCILEKYFYKNEIKSDKSFIKAIELAKADNIVAPFLEHSRYIKDIIQSNKNKHSFIDVIISHIEKYENCKKNDFVELTRREIEVMKLLSEGLRQNEISEQLHIALTTVKKHVSSVYDKIGVRNKTKALNILKTYNII